MLNIPELKILYLTDPHASTFVIDASDVFGDANPVTGIGLRYPGYDDVSIPAALAQAVTDGVDVILLGGDNINQASSDGINQRALNAQRFVAYFSGVTVPTIINYGHHDWGGAFSATAADFLQMYDNTDGFGTLMPTPVSTWTADIVGIAAGTPHAYTYEYNNYVFVVLMSGISGPGIQLTTEDGSGQSQNQWFAARLAEIDTAGKQAIIMIHNPMIHGDDWSFLADQAGLDDALSAIDGMTKKPIIFEGHVHEDSDTVIRNNVPYINGRGDLWTPEGDADTDRQSHSIVTIRPNAVHRDGSLQTNIEIVGYGYSGSKTFDSYFIG